MSKKLPEDERKRRILERTKKWREKNRERHLGQAREYSQKARQRRPYIMLRTNYGIPLEEAKMLWEQMQTARCQICDGDGRVMFDHDHKTGKFRGFLCQACNSGLGVFCDSPELLLKAIRYLSYKTL